MSRSDGCNHNAHQWCRSRQPDVPYGCDCPCHDNPVGVTVPSPEVEQANRARQQAHRNARRRVKRK